MFGLLNQLHAAVANGPSDVANTSFYSSDKNFDPDYTLSNSLASGSISTGGSKDTIQRSMDVFNSSFGDQ
eukprot:CAMPEP_0181298970 /NCGR_PEP_ID=MMETSP1101-20121128/6077_1 /TAXON_ID=46948 /ORGANISM="Rhodomonas abbreviata, Strain Caron Lab Isolate" /LENGTH=69 /DNA_ID=CAMNT_0023404049 /DNA_START=19 /DNA_END=228 /DNA_ORIENTATION=+